MAWSDQIFRYCERGSDPAFWAEPANAATNAAFFLAGALALGELARGQAVRRRLPETLLILLILLIGVGSFLFHTQATAWAAVADTAPIGTFMLAYLVYALRRYLGLAWPWVAAALAVFIGALRFAGSLECKVGLIAAVPPPGPCLNGTAGYLPAFIAMLLIAMALAARRHPAWSYLATASVVFLVSMTLRTIDLEVCEATHVAGHRLGTHFLWHLLNATTLCILALAAIRHGERR